MVLFSDDLQPKLPDTESYYDLQTVLLKKATLCASSVTKSNIFTVSANVNES